MNTATDSTATATPVAVKAGLVKQKKNRLTSGGTVSLYKAAEAGIVLTPASPDAKPDKYAVVCELHSTQTGVATRRAAREFLSKPQFCTSCVTNATTPAPEASNESSSN